MSESEQFVELRPERIPDLNAQPLQFVVCDKFSTFIAEVAIAGSDFVFHFYLPKEGVQDYAWYWETFFPSNLDRVAQDYFKVTAPTPRLKAMRVHDLGIDSWWMRAYGFATQVLDPDAFVLNFYQKLHAALSART